jgi:hypothetical protein
MLALKGGARGFIFRFLNKLSRNRALLCVRARRALGKLSQPDYDLTAEKADVTIEPFMRFSLDPRASWRATFK